MDPTETASLDLLAELHAQLEFAHLARRGDSPPAATRPNAIDHPAAECAEG
jgi:hypothetical protein